MPLPSIRQYGAKQCAAKSKRTGLPCNNPAAYGCRTCRMHGARKPETIKRGTQHPNYVYGMRTLKNQKERSAVSCRLQQIEDAMNLLGMTNTKRSRGRKANGYKKLESLDESKSELKSIFNNHKT